MNLLYLSEYQLHRKPQKGTPSILSWSNFADWLAEPLWGSDKNEGGGYSPALYQDNVRHLDQLISVDALVFDIDINGEVPRVAEAIRDLSCIVHETFSSSKESPRCRLLVELTAPIPASVYVGVHRLFRTELNKKYHIWPDEHATDASRLSFFPVRKPNSSYEFALTRGAAFDANALAAKTFYYIPKPVDKGPRHPDDTQENGGKPLPRQYVESAILHAQRNVGDADDGSRHHTLLKEAYSLARPALGLSFEDVENALLQVAVDRMGHHRSYEAQAAIRDAFRKRRGG